MSSRIESSETSKPGKRNLTDLIALAEQRPVKKTPLREFLDKATTRRKGRWTQIPGVEGAEYKSPHEMEMARQLDLECIVYEREQRIIPGRRFRADFTFREADRPTVLEIQGGVGWSQKRKGRASAHTSPDGILRDYEKGFLAQLNGYLVVQVSGAMVWDGTALKWIKLALGIDDERS